jgi:hypothetical protein
LGSFRSSANVPRRARPEPRPEGVVMTTAPNVASAASYSSRTQPHPDAASDTLRTP